VVLNFEDGEIIHNTWDIRITDYIYKYIELGYGTLQSTKSLCALRSIINFKSKMIDPNRSI
jgi:hypothetical protein